MVFMIEWIPVHNMKGKSAAKDNNKKNRIIDCNEFLLCAKHCDNMRMYVSIFKIVVKFT